MSGRGRTYKNKKINVVYLHKVHVIRYAFIIRVRKCVCLCMCACVYVCVFVAVIRE